MDGKLCAGYQFYSNFDSGNLQSVEVTSVKEATLRSSQEIPEIEFNLYTKPDCAEIERCNRTWFYFAFKAPRPWQTVRFNIVRLNKKAKLYSTGIVPVFRVEPSQPKWKRIGKETHFYCNKDKTFTLSFTFQTPENVGNMTYIAFTYPFTLDDLNCRLDLVDKFNLFQENIYYMRECVCYSLEGRRADLITITSFHNIITMQREARLRNLFPEMQPRPHKFRNKKVIFISARVHPGETPSSFVLNGLMQLLMDRLDPVAIKLRSKYVFKIIPCLNPDGVAMGHFLTDSKGVDLNRMYLDAEFGKHPTIYAARSLIMYYHCGYPKHEVGNYDVYDDATTYWCNKCNIKMSFTEQQREHDGQVLCVNCRQPAMNRDFAHGDQGKHDSGLYMYIDMHAHSAMKGIFMHGNYFKGIDDKIECMLMPKIMSLNNRNFHFTASRYKERSTGKKNRMNKGSGQVAVHKWTGLIRCYTLQCSYNTGKKVNVLPPLVNKVVSKVNANPVPPTYTPGVFEDVGKSIGASILDLTNDNPCSRMPRSEFRNLKGLRLWMHGAYLLEKYKRKVCSPQ